MPDETNTATNSDTGSDNLDTGNLVDLPAGDQDVGGGDNQVVEGGEGEKPVINFDSFQKHLHGANEEDDQGEADLPLLKPASNDPLAKELAAKMQKDKAEGKVKEEVEEPQPSPTRVIKEKPAKEVALKDNPADKRDYSDLPEEFRPLFRAMRNDSFDAMKKLYTEHSQLKPQYERLAQENEQLKQGKQIIPPSYYENPEAHTLLPEYKQLSAATQTAQQVVDHYQQQIINIRQGLDYTPLVQDSKTGQIMLGTPKKGEVQDEVEVMRALNSTQQQFMQLNNRTQQFGEQYKQKYNQIVTDIKKGENDFFKPYLDPKHPYHKLHGDIKGMFDSSLHSNPLFNLLTLSLTAAADLRDMVQALNKELGNKKTLAKDQAKAGPTGSKVNGQAAATGGGKKAVNFDDFTKVMVS